MASNYYQRSYEGLEKKYIITLTQLIYLNHIPAQHCIELSIFGVIISLTYGIKVVRNE
jgi:hypothetical protein